jgi:hypothetical protein
MTYNDQVNPLIKYLAKNKSEDVFHSSAYAKMQNGSSIGAASSQSFAERKRMEENRQRIRGYRDSGLMSRAAANGPRPKVFTPPEGGALNSPGNLGKSVGNLGKK